ncbi:MAG: molybdopterin-guanine dinucleotide biosynthesis protein A [Kiloniellales bacterium]|nr:molybdopterin-guanine dinucleotide biosynthesis protein A [Kiloniellales bacterium]
MVLRQAALLFSLLLVLAGWSGALRADDRHAGYYYPEPQTQETYEARAETLEETSRAVRIGFATGLANQLRARPHAPTMAVFAKGADAQKLILVALQDGRIETLYRARAVFADLTAIARVMPLFAEYGVQDVFTFFDLAKMLGFTQITISDGDDFAHQVFIE